MGRWITLAVVAGTFAAGMAASAESGRAKHPGRHKSIGKFLDHSEGIEELGLGSAQVAELRSLQHEAKKARITLRVEHEQARLEVNHLLGQDEPDESAVLAAIDKAGQAQIAVQKSDVRFRLKERTILGPDKWKQLRCLARQHMRHRFETRMQGRRHQPRHGRGPAGPRSDTGQNPNPGFGPDAMWDDPWFDRGESGLGLPPQEEG